MRCTRCPGNPTMTATHSTAAGMRVYSYACPRCAHTERRSYALAGPKPPKSAPPHLHTVPAEALEAPFAPPLPDPK